MSTPMNPVPHVATPPSAGHTTNKSEWERALDWLDKTRVIHLPRHLDGWGHIANIGRQLHERRGTIWLKEHLHNVPASIKAFRVHEYFMLVKFAQGLKHCYHQSNFSGSNVDSDVRVAGMPSGESPAKLWTTDKGVALKQWLKWPVQTQDGQLHDHVFRLPGHYLRFAKGALTALDELHGTKVVHCDLHDGNWCLESKMVPLTRNKSLQVKPLWDQVGIIDLGYSLHPSMQLPTQLPLDPKSMSRHLRALFDEATAAGKKAFDKLTEVEKKPWLIYEDKAEFDPVFWSSYASSELAVYKKVSWREDYRRLGLVLAEMRANGVSKAPMNSELQISDEGVVNKLIGEVASETGDTAAHGLANELIALGNVDTGDNNVRVKLHQQLMARLNKAIDALRDDDDSQLVFLRDDDFAAKAEQIDRNPENHKVAWEQARSKDTVEGYDEYLGKCQTDPSFRAFEDAARTAKARLLARPPNPWIERTKNAALILSLAAAAGSAAYGYDNWFKPTLTSWQIERKEAERVAKEQKEAAAAAADRLALEAAAQAQAATQRIQTAQKTVQRADFGSAPWRSAIAELATLCQPPQPGGAAPAQTAPATTATTTADCTAAFTQIQQDYLRVSSQAQKTPWWSEGRYNIQPSEDMHNWLFATHTLAAQGLWVAQVNQAMVDTVAAARSIKDLDPSPAQRIAGAQKLAALVTPQQPPASTYAVTVPPEIGQALRFEAADLLWSMHREGEGQNGVPLPRQLAPTALVLPVVQAVADMPNQAAQAMLAYSLICWTDKPDEAQALAYFAKAEVAQNGNNQAIADKAKDMRLAHQNGGQLCQK